MATQFRLVEPLDLLYTDDVSLPQTMSGDSTVNEFFNFRIPEEAA